MYHPQGVMSCPLALHAALIKIGVHLLGTVFSYSSLIIELSCRCECRAAANAIEFDLIQLSRRRSAGAKSNHIPHL